MDKQEVILINNLLDRFSTKTIIKIIDLSSGKIIYEGTALKMATVLDPSFGLVDIVKISHKPDCIEFLV